MAWSRRIEPAMCTHYIHLWQQDLITWEQRLRDAPTLLSAKAALGELDLVPSGPSLYALAGIMGRTGRLGVDEFTRGGLRRAGELVRRAIIAEERSELVDANRRRIRRLAVGRHRRPTGPLSTLSTDIDDAGVPPCVAHETADNTFREQPDAEGSTCLSTDSP
jgi:hypothetical protein